MTPMLRGMRGIAPLQVRAGSGALFAPLPNQGSFLSRCKCLRLESTRPTDDACTFIPLSSPVLATCRGTSQMSEAWQADSRPGPATAGLSYRSGQAISRVSEGRGVEEGDCVTAPNQWGGEGVSVCSLQHAACSFCKPTYLGSFISCTSTVSLVLPTLRPSVAVPVCIHTKRPGCLSGVTVFPSSSHLPACPRNRRRRRMLVSPLSAAVNRAATPTTSPDFSSRPPNNFDVGLDVDLT